MTRYFVHLAYKGTNYHGWQYQPNAITVQEVLNQAISTIFKETVQLTGVGRTDTGVHARNFYAHFDTTHIISENKEKIVYNLNCLLPDDISIYDIYEMNNSAHARFDAIEREYKYYMSRKKEIFDKDYCWQFYPKLNIREMNKAAEVLFEYSDFTSFSKLNTDVKTNNCEIYSAKWVQKDQMLIFTISANRFLRNMVRSLVGTLIEIGLGKRSINDFKELIEKKDRMLAGSSAPAQGLFLEKIRYPYVIK